ncbi:hypothetical protein DOTSEDRAFT_74837 [Dothistroma septosporum NZE10]|uniref:Uncharacterized protein n=1 Tax=Dothistroma septosporum (strain NZE10 / CBS 128990) TaxID=675120 RepID=N1PDF7_DOTSN|nr:hypothetical protein DOTSEDRAFT_74837 [Dothistroma septosporum NZE10]
MKMDNLNVMYRFEVVIKLPQPPQAVGMYEWRHRYLGTDPLVARVYYLVQRDGITRARCLSIRRVLAALPALPII